MKNTDKPLNEPCVNYETNRPRPWQQVEISPEKASSKKKYIIRKHEELEAQEEIQEYKDTQS